MVHNMGPDTDTGIFTRPEKVISGQDYHTNTVNKLKNLKKMVCWLMHCFCVFRILDHLYNFKWKRRFILNLFINYYNKLKI